MTEKRANFRVPEVEYEVFSELCKLNDSTASRELRLFIKDYIKRYSTLEFRNDD